jgi:methionyl-tRNA formyltransferase
VRLIFLGTPEFAVPTLEAIVAAGHEVLAVLTQPDRPRGRGREVAAPPVKRMAQRLGLEVHQPERIRRPEVVEFLADLRPEAMVVVGYGKIIPQSIIDIPPHGIINVHASLLPKYRGAAPVQWAVASGETRTGVTTMRIDAGLDTGDILLQRETEIATEETAVEVSERLALMGAALLVETLAGLEQGRIVPRKQDSSQATYAPMIRKEDGRIDWSRPAVDIANRIRGLVPWPGCYSGFRGRLMHIWKARPGGAVSGMPGTVHPARGRVMVSCGFESSLELIEVQLEGKRRMAAADFLNGYRVEENELLEMSE